MGFANPYLLGLGLALLAVPLLLLLINRKRQVIPWGAYYWMALAAAKKKKRVRVTEWLKLISKLLLVLAAGLLLARPFLGLGSQEHTLLIVDNSPSMMTVNGNATRLDAARERALLIIRKTPGKLTLATFADKLRILSRAQTDTAGMERAIASIAPQAGAGSGRDLTDGVLGLDNLRDYGNIVVLSDFQRQTFADGTVLKELGSRLPESCRVTLVPVDNRADTPNLALLGWKLAPEGLHAGRENAIEVQVRNFGRDNANQVPITLALDGRQTDRAYLNLAAGETGSVWLSCPLPNAEPHELTIALPPDNYPIDDQLDILLAPRSRLNVLAVVPEQAPDARYPRDVFVRSALLAAGGEDAWHYQSVSPLEALHEELGNYDLVVLLGVPLRAEDPFTPRLHDYVASGRGAISFADCDVEDFWSGFQVKQGAVDSTERTVDPQRLAGGYLAFLRTKGMDASQIHVFRSYPLPETPPAEARLFLTGSEAPVIRCLPVGKGRLVCVGFQPAPGYTDLYYNPNFVQFTQRAAWEAMGLRPDQAVIGADFAWLPLSGLTPNHRYAWGPENEAQQAVPLVVEGQSAHLALEPKLAGGFFTITEDDKPLLRFGYNPSRADSDVEPAGASLREAAGDRVRVVDAGDTSGGATRELAWLALLVFLLALGLENYAHLVRRN